MGNEQSSDKERGHKKEGKKERPEEEGASTKEQKRTKAVFTTRPKLKKPTFDTPLHAAVDSGDMEKVLALVIDPDTDLDIRVRCQDERNRAVARKFFHWTLDRRLYDIIPAIMARPDFDINSRNGDGRTPLQVACLQCNKRLVTMLLENPAADVNLVVPRCAQYASFQLEHRSPLSIAAEVQSTEIMNELLTSRADTIDINETERMNASLHGSENALLIACRVGFTEGVEILLNCASLDVNVKTNGQSGTQHPLDVACTGGHFDIAKLLLARQDLEIRTDNQGVHGLMSNAIHYCWLKLQIETARLISEHPSFQAPSAKRVKDMIQYYPPTVNDPLARAEFIAFFCAVLEVPPSELIGEEDPALQLIFSRKKSAYK